LSAWLLEGAGMDEDEDNDGTSLIRALVEVR
jgi:hypothetical protein